MLCCQRVLGWGRFALLWGCVLVCGTARGAGVTLITHGYGGNVADWVIPMCNRIPLRSDFPGTNHTRYQFSITRSGNLLYTTVTLLGGGDPLTSDSGEIIIALDWSTLSSLGGASSSEIAAEAAEALLASNLIPALGGRRLAELPLHLIGHSRGASVVAEMARELGAVGVWVEHQTTLDPYPVNLLGDPGTMRNYANVFYADNYWQNRDFPAGKSLAGAYNRYLPELSGGYASGQNHSDTHLWYHGTVDGNTPAGDNLATITSAQRSTWWTALEQAGTNAGFRYSLIGGGDRFSSQEPNGPGNGRINDGVNRKWDLGAGAGANRTSLPANSGAWPNLVRLSLAGTNVVVSGQPVPIALYYQLGAAPAATGSLSLYLDLDANPYNENETELLNCTLSGTGPNAVAALSTNAQPNPAAIMPRTYRLFGRLADGSRARYLYAPQTITLTPSLQAPTLLDPVWQGNQFRFTLAAMPGQRIVIQRTPDFQTWTPVVTNVMRGPSAQIILSASSADPPGFYRALLTP